MKAHYYLAQALLPQRHVGEALDEAKLAYSICIDIQDPSADVIGTFILRAKQAKWQVRETTRLREMNETLALVEDLLDAQLQRDTNAVTLRYRNGEIGNTGRVEEIEGLQTEADVRRANIRRGFEDSKKPATVERVSSGPTRSPHSVTDTVQQVVPDWLIDPITFEVMHDPMVTPTGVSYERVSLLKHVKASGFDPITRQPLKVDQLIPNVALKNACSEFLEQNGWAADW